MSVQESLSLENHDQDDRDKENTREENDLEDELSQKVLKHESNCPEEDNRRASLITFLEKTASSR